MELGEFLLARIAEDEAVAQMCPPGPWSFNGPARETSVYSEPTGVTVAHVWQRDAHHIARHDPARVLLECDTKRRIVERHEGIGYPNPKDEPLDLACTGGGKPRYPDECPDLRLLALPYADHPDYDESWRT